MLTKERAYELWIPDFATGILCWRIKPARNIKAGKKAGTLGSNGYWYVTVDKKMYLTHRVLWLMYYGNWPLKNIDHIDRNSQNNAIHNLRDVTQSENLHNAKVKWTSETKAKGVFPNGNGFMARVKVNGKNKYLGTYPTIEAASAAYTKELENVYKIDTD